MSFEVRFTSEDEENVLEIRNWTAKRSSDGVLRWLDALETAKTRLQATADACPLAPETDAFVDELRQILFRTRRGNTYRALFVIRENTVHVVSVRGSGQDLMTPDEFSGLP